MIVSSTIKPIVTIHIRVICLEMQVSLSVAKLLNHTIGSGAYKYSLCFWVKLDSGLADETYVLAHATALEYLILQF